MRRLTFLQLLTKTARLCGLQRLQPELGQSLAEWLNARLNYAWTAFPWPFLCPIEERGWRDAWAAATDYSAGDEVRHADGDGVTLYFEALLDSQGIEPGTDEATWGELSTTDRFIPFDQLGATPFEDVFGVWKDDPRKVKAPRTVAFWIGVDRVQLAPDAPATVFVQFRRLPLKLTGEAFSLAQVQSYHARDAVYYAPDCYLRNARPFGELRVAGAGDAAVNEDYVETGTANDRALYLHPDGGFAVHYRTRVVIGGSAETGVNSGIGYIETGAYLTAALYIHPSGDFAIRFAGVWQIVEYDNGTFGGVLHEGDDETDPWLSLWLDGPSQVEEDTRWALDVYSDGAFGAEIYRAVSSATNPWDTEWTALRRVTVSGGAMIDGNSTDGEFEESGDEAGGQPIYRRVDDADFELLTSGPGTGTWTLQITGGGGGGFFFGGVSESDPSSAGLGTYQGSGGGAAGGVTVVYTAGSFTSSVAPAVTENSKLPTNTDFWALQEIPEKLAEYAARAAKADYLADDGQDDKSFAQDRRAIDWLELEMVNLTVLQNQTANYSVK